MSKRRMAAEMLIVGIGESIVGRVATLLFGEVVEHDTIRDVGYLVIWVTVILAGTGLLIARWWPTQAVHIAAEPTAPQGDGRADRAEQEAADLRAELQRVALERNVNAGWAESVVESDRQHLGQRVLVLPPGDPNFSFLGNTKPYILFAFSVFNGSVFDIHIDGEGIRGNVSLETPENLLGEVPEFARPNGGIIITHGDTQIIQLRLVLTKAEADAIPPPMERRMRFDFGNVTVPVRAANDPIGKDRSDLPRQKLALERYTFERHS